MPNTINLIPAYRLFAILQLLYEENKHRWHNIKILIKIFDKERFT